MTSLTKNQVTIDAMSNGPYAIAHDEKLGVVFVENVCPGDIAEIEIYDQRKGFSFANATEVIEPSPLRMDKPPCAIHKICGSCQWQHIDYVEQLKFKKQNLIDLLAKSGIDYGEVPDLIGMDNPWNYRNKIIYPVDTVASTGRLIAGYFKRNTNELINVKYCPIQYGIFDEIMAFTKDLCSKRGITKGRLRHILMRSNIDQSEILLSFIIRRKNLNHEEQKLLIKILKEIRSKFPVIKAISLNYNDLSTNVILGNKTEVIDERAYIQEKFADIELRISTASFFQVNTQQFLKIINLLKTFIDKPNARILDLYCGIGTISLSLAKAFPELDVTGIEIVPEAIEDAKTNAIVNNIAQTKFILGKAEDVLSTEGSHAYDTVIVNPPRKGCTNAVLDALNEINSHKIIYVSCNPATLTRDIKYLEQYGYKLSYVQPVDMFPHSFHFETVAVLTQTATA